MARRIDTQAEIDWVRLADQAGDPASPAAGYKYFYAKAGGLYAINSAGAVTGPLVMTTVATDPIFDAAGDLVQGTGANTAAKLSLGTYPQILRVNSGATAAEWVSAGRVLISQQTPTGTGTVTWSSIPATYNSLELEIIARSDKAAVTAENAYLWLNNDTTAANYRQVIAEWYQTTARASAADTSYGIQVAAANAPANSATMGFVKIINYASTTFYKYVRAWDVVRRDNSTNNVYGHIWHNEWESTTAINRIDIILDSGGNYIAGTTFRLYGVF